MKQLITDSQVTEGKKTVSIRTDITRATLFIIIITILLYLSKRLAIEQNISYQQECPAEKVLSLQALI
jgi:hypothetical protein